MCEHHMSVNSQVSNNFQSCGEIESNRKFEFCEEVLRWCCYTFKNWKFLTLYIIAEEVKWNFQLKNIKTIMKMKY